MYKYLLVCIILTIFGAFGGFFFKKATNEAENLFKIIFTPYLYIGGICYLTGAVLNIWVLKNLNYTVVLPMTAITYIWTLLISFFLLKEKLSNKKIAGVGLIVIGAVILGIS